MPVLTNDREKYLVCGLKAVEATKDMMIRIEDDAMITCPLGAYSIVLVALYFDQTLLSLTFEGWKLKMKSKSPFSKTINLSYSCVRVTY